MRPILKAMLVASLTAGLAAPAAAQLLQKGVLLTAAPDLDGHHFARSVVLVVHHDTNGSIGLVVNRPTRLRAVDTFPGIEALGDYPGRVFVGGPVSPTSLLILVRDEAGGLADSEPVHGSVHVVGDPERLSGLAGLTGGESTLRIFAGRTQWEPGQLASEISDGRWRVLPGDADAVFSAAPVALYGELAERGAELVVAEDR